MHKANSTTSNAMQIKLQKQVTNHGNVVVGESFRVLYYGTASSVPFIWESQPGTPKHALTESSLPPLTPPPSYYQTSYNSSKDLTNLKSSKTSGTIFVPSLRKRNMSGTSFSSCSVSSSASSGLHSAQSTPSRKKEVRSMLSPVKFGMEDENPGGCLVGGFSFKKSSRIKNVKKVMMSFVSHGKTRLN